MNLKVYFFFFVQRHCTIRCVSNRTYRWEKFVGGVWDLFSFTLQIHGWSDTRSNHFRLSQWFFTVVEDIHFGLMHQHVEISTESWYQ